MYCLIMKTSVEFDFKSKTFCFTKSYVRPREKKTRLIDYKFYQKSFVFLFSMSTILIIPEIPKELENICQNYNSRKSCIVW